MENEPLPSSSILNSIEVWNRRKGCLSEPKSERAKRELLIPQLCLMELLSHRETQNQSNWYWLMG